jgi:hypothetical protein
MTAIIKRQITITAIVFALTAVSCGRTTETLQSYAANFYGTEEIPLARIASDIRKIPLETGDAILIKYISRVIDTGERLLVYHGDRCSLFDTAGKYVRDIGGRGQGPREWTDLTTTFVRNDSVFFYDENRRKFLIFDFDGAFVREMKMPEKDDYYEVFPLHGNALLLFTPSRTGAEKTRFAFMDAAGVETEIPYCGEFEKNFVQMFYFYEGAVFHCGGHDYFKETFNDTIFTVQADRTVSPRLVLDFGKYGASLEKRHSLADPGANVFENMVNVRIIGESASFLFFTATLHRQSHCFYLDKQRRTLHNASFSLPDDMKAEKPFVPLCVSEDGKRLVGVAEAESDDNPSLVVAVLK